MPALKYFFYAKLILKQHKLYATIYLQNFVFSVVHKLLVGIKNISVFI